MKPIWAKFTFWRRLPGFHPAIRKTAFSTAMHSGRTFKRYGAASAAAPDGEFHQSAATTAHPFWAEAFEPDRKKIREMLEIGAFEGRTTAFAARLFPNARITCVDPWIDYAEMKDLSRAEQSFQRNITEFKDRVRAIKGYSKDILPALLEEGRSFDVVFVDGSHAYLDVAFDTDLGWLLLKPGGVMIWDDYLWKKSEYGKFVPKLAIDEFLTANHGRYSPLWAFKQVAVRKNREMK